MFDWQKRRESYDLQVSDLISELEKENQRAKVVCCGSSRVVLHSEKDGSAVCIDTESLSDDYLDDPTFDEDNDDIPLIEANQKCSCMTLPRAYELMHNLISHLYQCSEAEIMINDLTSDEIGFTSEELSDLGFIILKSEDNTEDNIQ